MDMRPGHIIGIQSTRSINTFAFLVASLQKGVIFTPMDASYNSHRLSYIEKNSNLKFILVDEVPLDVTEHAVPFISIDNLITFSDVVKDASSSKNHQVNADMAACILYTSGSTGNPKGVVRSHNAVFSQSQFLFSRKNKHQNDIVAQIAPLTFVPSLVQLFGSLAIGSTISIVDDFYKHNPEALISKCNNDKITKISLVPSLVEMVQQVLTDKHLSFSSLKKITSTGERLSATTIQNHFNLLPNVELVTVYGSTEMGGVGSCVYTKERPVETIFNLYPNVEVKIMDENALTLTEGETGEICIKSPSVAHYFDLGLEKNDKASEELFFRTGDFGYLDAENKLTVLGRNDDQVKIHDQRIHLEEINLKIKTFPGIDKSLVLMKEKKIIFYFTTKKNISPQELKDYAAEYLPREFVPHNFIHLQEFPLLINGKIDRVSLPVEGTPCPISTKFFEIPNNEYEMTLRQIWGEILVMPSETIPLTSGFFDLGGDSLSIVRLQLKVEKIFTNHKISSTDFFAFPSIKEFSNYLLSKEDTPSKATFQNESTSLQSEDASTGSSSDIAIIGISCKFPGSDSVEEYWDALTSGMESLRNLDKHEAQIRQSSSPFPSSQESIIPAVLELKDTDKFDADFFGFSDREAQLLDPQHRIMMEVAWHALEDAGYIQEDPNIKKGIFVGASDSKYFFNNILLNQVLKSRSEFSFSHMLNSAQFLATRLAYIFNAKGPALTINTACSTSLVAVGTACQSLRDGHCDLAIAGGVSLNLPDESLSIFQPGGILSEDGVCRPFDASGGGTLFGSGVGVVVLKKLDQALKDNDTVIAVIKGVAINNDGNEKVGFTAPSHAGQVTCIKEALSDAQVTPNTIGYVEAHGTGTRLGDPIEFSALTEAMGLGGYRKGTCGLGSVKGNLGHTNVASGVAGLIKASLCLYHQKLVPSLNCTLVNPAIDLSSSPFYLTKSVEHWTLHPSQILRRASVNSLGIGGTNAHVVLEEAPLEHKLHCPKSFYLLTFSAKTPSSLKNHLTEMLHFLEKIQANPSSAPDLRDIEFSLWHGRQKFPYRYSVVCSTIEMAISRITSFLQNDQPTNPQLLDIGFLYRDITHASPIVELYKDSSLFKDLLDQSAQNITAQDSSFRCTSKEIIERCIQNDAEPNRYENTLCHFIVIYSLSQLLLHLGIEPKFSAGHFLGNLVSRSLQDSSLFKTIVRGIRTGNFDSIPLSPDVNYTELDINLSDLETFASRYPSMIFIDLSNLSFLNLPPLDVKVPPNSSPDLKPFYDILCRLWSEGNELDLDKFVFPGRRISLPLYAFDKNTYWISRKASSLAKDHSLDHEQAFSHNELEYVENRVVAIWQELFQNPSIDLNSNFYDLGGHSLLALQLASKLNEELGVTFITSDILESSTIKAISQTVHAHGCPKTVDISPSLLKVSDGKFPLSMAQERIWLLDQMYPDAAMTHVPIAMKLKGSVDTQKLNQALNFLIKKHAMLRSYVVNEEGLLAQKLGDSKQPFTVIEENLEHKDQYNSLLNSYLNKPFSLSEPFLFRVIKIKNPDDQTILLFIFHHIIMDGWSLGIFWKELNAAYQNPLLLSENSSSPMPVYENYVREQSVKIKNKGFEKEIAYWKKQLADIPQTLLPPHNVIYDSSLISQVDVVRWQVDDPELLKLIDDLCAKNTCSRFVFFLAIFLLLLFYYSGSEDMSTISMFSNRNTNDEQKIIGLFANPHILRVDLTSLQNIDDLLQATKKTVLGALDHQAAPFELITKHVLTSESLNSLINTLFLFHESYWKDDSFLGHPIAKTIPIVPSSIQQDLCLEVVNRSTSLGFTLSYSKSLFDGTLIQQFSENYMSLITQLVELPSRFIKDISLYALSSVEASHTSASLEMTSPMKDKDYPFHRSIWDLFEKVVSQHSDKTALVTDTGDSLSFSDLYEKANRIALYLVEIGIKKGDIIGVSLSPSQDLIITILAILKVGGIYLPLDPLYPKARLEFYVKHSNAQWVISTWEITKNVFDSHETGYQVIFMSDMASAYQNPIASEFPKSQPNDIALIIYTSGSTGDPKGVMINQKSIINRCFWFHNTYGKQKAEVGCLSTTINFVDSIAEIFGSLLFGEKLLLISRENISHVPTFLSLIEKYHVTKLVLVPSFLEMIIHSASDPKYFRSVHTLTSSGESLPASLVKSFLELYPHVKLLNFYGSTEVMADVTAFDTSSLSLENLSTIPLGQSITHTSIHIVNNYGACLPHGAIGNIHVSGICLAEGYLNNHEKTTEAFVSLVSQGKTLRAYNTKDRGYYIGTGDLIYRGRTDTLTKLNGNTLDLAEIQECLNTHPLVNKNICLIREQTSQKQLVAYVVSSQTDLSHRELKSKLFTHLRSHLPRYMIPSILVILDHFPLTSNGKTNKQALLAFDPPQEPWVSEPKTDIQKRLSIVWCKILNVKSLSIYDSFFEIGGSSLLAIRLLIELEDTFNIKLKFTDIIKTPSIFALEQQIMELQDPQSGSIKRPSSRSSGSILAFHPITGLVSDYTRLEPHLETFDLLPISYPFGKKPNFSSIESMVSSYISDHSLDKIEGPLFLMGHSMGGILALEAAHQLTSKGRSVEHVFLIDTYFPRKEIAEHSCIATEIQKIKTFLFSHNVSKSDQSKILPLIAHHMNLLGNYDPISYSGKTTLLATSAYPSSMKDSWEKTIQYLTVVPIPGNHYSLFSEEHISELIHSLKPLSIYSNSLNMKRSA